MYDLIEEMESELADALREDLKKVSSFLSLSWVPAHTSSHIPLMHPHTYTPPHTHPLSHIKDFKTAVGSEIILPKNEIA